VRLSDLLREVSESLSVLEPDPVPVPDTVPSGLPVLEPVGGDSPDHAGATVSTARVRDVVAA
jgi:hypothetical protein